MANQAVEKDFEASPIREESSSQTHQEELVMGPDIILSHHGTVTKQQRDSKDAEEHPSTSRSHSSADQDTTDSCPQAMRNSLRPFPTESSNRMEIEETVIRTTLRYNKGLKPNDSGPYLKLNDSDRSGDPYRLEMSQFLPGPGKIRQKYTFHWTPVRFKAGLLTVLNYYVALDTSVATPKNLVVVAKRPPDNGAALIHRHRPEGSQSHCMLFFNYKGEIYQVKVEDGVPIVEKRKSQHRLNHSYMWIASLPTAEECLSQVWTKQFPGLGENVYKDEPRDDHTGLRYCHQGMVMELIPGQTPRMKAVDAEHPKECIDGGSLMKELIKKPKVISPVENCWVESGFCAYLVLNYTDPENPKLEAMNSPTLHKKLKEEGFTPLVNIARESSTSSQDDYTTALFFTTEKYTYYIHVDHNHNLVLKKYKTGDGSSEAKPQNNKQFLDKRYPDSCSTCGQPKGKEEVDGEGAKRVEKMSVDSFDAEDSVESSSNPRSSGASSQLSSPEGSSISPSKSKLLQANEKPGASNESETMDSGVEAN